MPIYDFACDSCKTVQEIFSSIADCPAKIRCSCGSDMKKIITLGHGGIFREEPTWMSGEGGRQMRECLQDSDRLRAGLDEPITTRTQWKKHLDKYGLIPAPKSAGNLLEV